LFKVKRQDLNLLALQEDDVPEGPLPERSFKAGGTLNGRGNSKGLPISQSSGQLGSMKAAGSSESDDIEVELPPAMTCIPLEINTTPHRYYVPESKVLTSTTHFPQLFHLQFSTYGIYIYIYIFSPPTYGRHHEVPLKELNSVQPENGKKDCSKKSGRLQIERKKSGISKKQQALQTFNVFPENVASESEAERPVVVKVASHGELWARNQVRCAQPQSFEHHHDMDVAR
jgi:hypothetical protein